VSNGSRDLHPVSRCLKALHDPSAVGLVVNKRAIGFDAGRDIHDVPRKLLETGRFGNSDSSGISAGLHLII
jgi:hypothetical protein